MSGALRIILVSGFAVYVVFAPAHPLGLLASQHRLRGLPVRPPRGLPQNRAETSHLTVVACTRGTSPPGPRLTNRCNSRISHSTLVRVGCRRQHLDSVSTSWTGREQHKNFAGGRVLPGLVARREAKGALLSAEKVNV